MKPGLAILVLCLAPRLDAADVAVIPDVALRLKAAAYLPSEDSFHWDGWMGGEAGLLRVEKTTGYVSGDVETVIGNEKRAFDANQANYHLEAGFRRSFGRHEAELAFSHVSRHLVDRPKDQAVDWNLIAARANLRFPEAFGVPMRVTLGIGHTTLTSWVDYEWELTARLEADLLRRDWGRLYGIAGVRGVTTDPAGPYARDGFADFLLEGGASFDRSGRRLAFFAAYEHRNDVLLLVPGYRDRALIGLRIDYATDPGSAPPKH